MKPSRPRIGDWKTLAGSHWPIVLVAFISLGLLLTNLGGDYLWADEGDTAVLARTILKCGLPKAWDGVTFTDSDKGMRENGDLVMVSHPWVQYYLTAASFLLLGESSFAARLPFALAGWLTILLGYALVRRITPGRYAASGAAILMVLSVQFLLYARQCRNYSLTMLFTCGLIWVFFALRSSKTCALFALAAIVLFHTNPLGIVPIAVLGILTLIYRPFRSQRRWFWLAAPAVALGTLPWLVLARTGYQAASNPLESIGEFFRRYAQYIVECASVTPLVGIAVLIALGLAGWRLRKRKAGFLSTDERSLMIITFATLFGYGIAIAATQSTRAQWFIGIRHATPAIPLLAMVAALLIAKIARERLAIWVALVLLFGLTKAALLTPYTLWAPRIIAPAGNKSVALHVPERTVDGLLPTEQILFLNDLRQSNPGTIAKICEFLQANAQAGDILLANYGWEPLYFHTRLAQALKILPEYPIVDAARRHGLPDYVFDVDHTRWIVWRPVWEGYQGYHWPKLAQDIFARGGYLKKVAQVEETHWENREDIHFRRFSGGRYIFPQPKELPPAIILRVEWLDDKPR